ncbi:MAG: hypothetical protein KDD60_07680, partial [Bdellovibrionales bacterium]|nr:hypothetical protein [Bdellovibrionales bacterium]
MFAQQLPQEPIFPPSPDQALKDFIEDRTTVARGERARELLNEIQPHYPVYGALPPLEPLSLTSPPPSREVPLPGMTTLTDFVSGR